MRKYLTILISIILLAGAFFIAKSLVNRDKIKAPQAETVSQTAFVKEVKNSSIPIIIKASGRLVSKNRMDVFAEVQGVMEITGKDFKPGTAFKKGEVMVKIRSNDYYANLQAQKSVLQNLITGILPDLRLDYPEAYEKWSSYLKNFNMNKPIGKLPETGSEKEKFFITSKNIYTTYYNTKNLEIVLEKYTLRAPFNGILTEAIVNPGTVVRPGQKLGEFIDPSVYELEVSISKSILPILKIGKKVMVTDPEDNSKSFSGKISRINGKINISTQTVNVYVDVRSSNLREGMYMEAMIEGIPKNNAYEIARSLIVDENNLYIVENNILKKVAVSILYKTKDSLVIQGLDDGVLLVSKVIPGAYNGMEVSIRSLD